MEEQWTNEEWKRLDALMAISLEELPVESKIERDKLFALTRSQREHPEWYDSPCLCQLCCSYGD